MSAPSQRASTARPRTPPPGPHLSSRVLAKYALLLPPRLAQRRQRPSDAINAASPPCTQRRRSSANCGA
jgi:hypothetical protein